MGSFYENCYTVLHMFTQVLFWAGNQGNHQKDQIILATGRGILADFWVPHEIDS